MTTTTLREAKNEVTIEGLLQEVRLNMKKSAKTGADFIGGEIDITTAQNEVHTVKVFANKLKKDGTENGIYKGLETVMNEYVSIAKVGKEHADRVRITGAKININDYVGGDGKVKSFPQLNTNFINRIAANAPFEPKAHFVVEAVVKSITEEFNKEGDETGRAVLNAIIPLYGGTVIPVTFVVNEQVASAMMDGIEPQQTVQLYGNIVNRVETTQVEQEVAFGVAPKKVSNKTIREFVITGGSAPYDEENAKSYNMSAIKQALTERNVKLETLKEKKKVEPVKQGFGTPPTIDIKEDDLPF